MPPPQTVHPTAAPSAIDFSQIKKPEELLSLAPDSTPYEFGQIFNMESMRQRSLSKKKLKQLKAFDSVIRSMLHPGERVFYLTDGVKCSTFEQMFIGWAVYYYNHNAFVFTSERILLIHLNGKRKLGKFVGEIQYGDLMKVKASGLFGSLKIKFRNKKSMVFGRVNRLDQKFIKQYLAPIVQGNPTEPDKSTPDISHLCPACYTHIQNKLAEKCPACKTEFKTPAQASIRSLFLPGLGDIYLGSHILGSIELLFMVYLWMGMIGGAFMEGEEGGDVGSYIIFMVVFIGIIHGIDALKTYYVAKKGIFPKRNIKQIRRERGIV